MVKRKADENKELKSKNLREEDVSESEDEHEEIESGQEVEGNGSDDDESDDGAEQEEENEDEDEDVQMQEAAKPTKQLSSQDVQVARETAELYKSNVFKLKIDELLKELKLDEGKKKQQLERSLFEINKLLQEIDDSKVYTIKEVNKAVKKVTIPFPDPKPSDNVNYKFQFIKPEDINVIGSYSLKTAVKQPEGMDIDLYVEMPSTLFTEKDYLNYRYFHKRAFYIAYIAQHLQNKFEKVKYAYLKDDMLKPIIKIKLENKVTVNIICGVSNQLFEPRKLGPERNCVRLISQDRKSEPHDEVPTPLYNSSLLSDTLFIKYLKFLHTASKQCEGFKDACKLGRLWLRQRGFGASYKIGGFGHFEFAMVMAVLLQGNSRVLLGGFSSYQLFQGTIRWIATELKRGVNFAIGENCKIGVKENFNFAAMLFDTENKFNILYKMSAWSLGMLQHEAAITADMLSDVVQDRFDAVFMRDLSNPRIRFDIVFDVEYDSSNAVFLPAAKVKYASFRHFFIEKLYRLLKRGYGDRVYQIALFDDNNELSSFKLSKRKSSESDEKIKVGLICDAETVDKVQTHGPSVEDSDEAEKFKAFWGEKSELRRYEDGRIIEMVPWKVNPTKPVVISIAEYLLELHSSDALPVVDFSESAQLLNYLPIADYKLDATTKISQASVVNKATFSAKTASFHRLATVIQSLTDIPLLAKNVFPASSSLRHSSIHQPLPFDIDGDDSLAKGVIVFESSTRWPDDLVAVEKTKTAFLLKISEELLKKSSGYKAYCGVDSDEISGFMTVQTPEGFEFELRIATDRDVMLMDRLELDTLDYKRGYTGAAEHSLMTYRLGLRHVYYSSAVRLVKRWFSSHLLLSQNNNIRDELVELLVLSVFIDSAPYTPPCSPTTAFHRVVDFLSRWNWRDDPLLLVEANDENVETAVKQLSRATGLDVDNTVYTNLGSGFSAYRSMDQQLTNSIPMYIASSADTTGVLWTKMTEKSERGKVVASRVTALARGIVNTDEPTLWFTPSLNDFDIVVQLVDPLASSSNSEYKNVVNSFPPFETCVDKSVDLFGELEKSVAERFNNELVVFNGRDTKTRRGKHGVLAAVWRPITHGKKKFRVNLDLNTKPVEDESVVVNKDAIVAMIQRLGGDLVKSIEYK